MPVPSVITDLSTVAASNSPAGSDAVFPDLDNYMRALSAFIAQNYTLKADRAGDTFTGSVSFNAGMILGSGFSFVPAVDSTTQLGSTTKRWGTIYAQNFSDGANLIINSSGAELRLASSSSWTSTVLGSASNTSFHPHTTNVTTLGGASNRWSNVYGVLGNYSGLLTASAGVTTTTLAITEGAIISGTYTPTLTNTTNVAASTARALQYMRVGNVVTVSGNVDIDPTTGGGTATVMGMTLPIASNIAQTWNAGGTGIDSSCTNLYHINGDATNDRVNFTTAANNAANQTVTFSFTYQVI